jgi:hypothetical protein
MSAARSRVLVAAIFVLIAGLAMAADAPKAVTVNGKIACAMCVLKHADAKSCANVLVVEENGKPVEYALADNSVLRGFGHGACEKAIPVKVTGTIAEKDGKRTMTAEKIEKV